MNNNNILLHNEFMFVLEDIKTKSKKIGHAYNIITDKGLSYARTGSSITGYIHVGKGNGEPATTDTSLFSLVRALSTTFHSTSYDASTKTYKSMFRVKLDETMDNGTLFTEVGLANSSSSNTLCTHAMIVDEHGLPMSIEKTDTTILTVYATVYVTLEDGKPYYRNPGYSTHYTLGNILTTSGRRATEIALMENTCFSSDQSKLSSTTTANGPNGTKVYFDALGANYNDKLYKYIGIGVSTDTYKMGPGLLYMAGETPGFDRTLITDYVVAKGDGDKTKFNVSRLYPVIKNEKVVVKVNDTVKQPVLETFTSLDLTEPLNGAHYVVNGVVYASVYSMDSSDAKVTLYKYTDFAKRKKVVIATGTFYTGSFYGSAAIIPTALTETTGKVLVGIAGHTSTQACYEGQIGADLNVTTGTKLSSGACTDMTPRHDGKVITCSSTVVAVSDNAHVLLAYAGSTCYGNVDNLIYDSYYGYVYKLDESGSTITLRKLDTVGYKYSATWNQFKKIGNNLYAFISVDTTSKKPAGLGYQAVTDTCNVTIIDSQTERITSETYTVVNDEYLNNANRSNYCGKLGYSYYNMFDVILNTEDKTAYIYCSSRRNGAPCNELYELSDGTYLLSSRTSYIAVKSKEFIKGMTFSEAPSIDDNIKLTGELDGFLKTSDYKLSFAIEYNVNAQNS